MNPAPRPKGRAKAKAKARAAADDDKDNADDGSRNVETPEPKRKKETQAVVVATKRVTLGVFDSSEQVDEVHDTAEAVAADMRGTPGRPRGRPPGGGELKIMKASKAEDSEVFDLASILEEKCLKEVHLQGRDLKLGEKSAYATVKIPIEFLRCV